jgi:DNA invertase Pin-like site-specific DNA recombinase
MSLARAIVSQQQVDSALRVAVWRRLSTAEQNAEGRSGLQRQRDQTNRVVEARGYQVIATFEVVDVSGASVALAPECRRLLQLVESGEIQAVVVSELSRLVRPDSLESLGIFDIFARSGCLIVADGQPIDFANPEGFLTGGIQALIAGHFRMNLLRTIHASKEAGRAKGWHVSSYKALPLGVAWDKSTRRFFYNEHIHRVVEAFRLADEEHLSMSAIGKHTGIQPSSVRGILENEIYTGWRVYREKRDLTIKRPGPDGRQGWRPKIARAPSEFIRIRVIEPGATSPERFLRVQAALAEVRRNHVSSNTVRHPNLCTMIGRCGYCFEPLYVTANGKRRKAGDKAYGYYCCKSHYPTYSGTLPKCGNGWVRRANLDEVLVAFCQRTLTDPALLTAIIEASARRTAEVVQAFPAPSKDEVLAKLRQRDKRLVEMCEAETLTIDEFRARRAKLREEITQLERLAEQNTLTTPTTSLDQLARQITNAAVRFSRIKDRIEQKSILTQLFAEVFFRHESITAFRFSKKFLADLGGGILASDTVQLEMPFRIREAPMRLPEGHKRCSCCAQVLPHTEFYARRAQCRPCYLKTQRAQRAAREEKRGGAEGSP